MADQYGWRLYATDDVMSEHARRTTPEEAPFLGAEIGRRRCSTVLCSLANVGGGCPQ
ncbi:hypothetical protein ABZV67_35150 [Streptomyces sp. NPDC005065]|uniref:hypothetical protein n=1 Tax=Streptomyces sp. NPDC005065 TaxID=3154461 RepID=UPI0033B43D7B